MNGIRCVACLTVILLSAGCQTAPHAEPEAESELPVITEAVPEPEPEPEPEPQPVVELPAPVAEREDLRRIEVPADLYNRAFEEVRGVIDDLNSIIQRGDYRTWLTYLTERYVEVYSDPEVLSRLSTEPILQQSNVTLRSLQDYFSRVVVPSRARARLDDLVFYSDTLVEAVSEFRGQQVILYLLRKVDGAWKIDTFEKPTSDQSEVRP